MDVLRTECIRLFSNNAFVHRVSANLNFSLRFINSAYVTRLRRKKGVCLISLVSWEVGNSVLFGSVWFGDKAYIQHTVERLPIRQQILRLRLYSTAYA